MIAVDESRNGLRISARCYRGEFCRDRKLRELSSWRRSCVRGTTIRRDKPLTPDFVFSVVKDVDLRRLAERLFWIPRAQNGEAASRSVRSVNWVTAELQRIR